MKKYILSFLFMVSLLASGQVFANSNYYLYNGNKIYLTPDKKELWVTGSFKVSDIVTQDQIIKTDTINNGTIIYLKQDYSGDIFNTSFDNSKFVSYSFDDEDTNTNHKRAFTSDIIIKLKQGASTSDFFNRVNLLGLTAKPSSSFTDQYIIQVPSYKYERYFNTLRAFENEAYTEFIEPNFNNIIDQGKNPMIQKQKSILTQKLKLGSRGEQVKILEQFLFDGGYLDITPDTYFGTSTRKAVQAFQREQGMTPDGSVGPKTRSIINGLLDK